MAVSDNRSQAQNPIPDALESLKVASKAFKDQLAATEHPPADRVDEDADVSDSDSSDSEDDSEDSSDDGDDNRDVGKADSTTAQTHGSPHQDGPVVPAGYGGSAQDTGKAKKSSKRPADEELRPEYDQSTMKKRKPLGELSESNSRTNVLASAFEVPDQKSVSAPIPSSSGSVTVTIKPRPKQRAVSASSLARASRSGNNWPRMQDGNEFAAANLADQRLELNSYRKDLFDYVDVIQAGAIPVQFVKSFLRRLDMHMTKMDSALRAAEKLQAKEKKRQLKIYSLQQESIQDNEELRQMLKNLVSPTAPET